jgi:hypothetical protein
MPHRFGERVERGQWLGQWLRERFGERVERGQWLGQWLRERFGERVERGQWLRQWLRQWLERRLGQWEHPVIHPDDQATEEPRGGLDDRSTRLGRRGRPEGPIPASEDTQLGRRRGVDGDPTPSADGTQLGRRRRDLEEAPRGTETESGSRSGTDSDASRNDTGDTRLGQRQRSADPVPRPTETPADGDQVIRFGPGVPRAPATSPQWASSSGSRPAAARRPHRRGWVGALITIALVAGVLAFLLTRETDPVGARAESVTAASVPGACDTVVDVVGTIATNGRPGSISYQWIRNDGQPTSVLTQDVPDGATSTQVHLQWTFSGQGRFDARATLRVLAPSPTSEAVGAFTYSCS